MVLIMSFQTDIGQTRNVRVNHAKPNLTGTLVSASMQDIIVSGALMDDRGRAVTAKAAQLVETTVTPVTLP